MRPNWTKWILILLLVVPLGLLAGLLIGRAVNPDMLVDGERISTGPDATERADAEVDRRNRELLDREEEQEGGPDSLRPDLDYEEEAWPQDFAGRRPGDPQRRGFFDDAPDFAEDPFFSDDYGPGAAPAPDSDAQAEVEPYRPPAAPEPPSSRYRPLDEREITPPPVDSPEPAEPPPAEPRTADGELPAIW